MNLAKSAMLVSVTIINGGLLGERRDAKASELVQTTFATAHRRTKASKYLIDRQHKSVKNIVASAQRVRDTVTRYTLPWSEAGTRLLPVKAYDTLCNKLKEDVVQLEKDWDAYVRVYPSLIAASERDLGELFNAAEYPTPKRLREMFVVRVSYWPMPETGHFVADIARDAANEARDSMKEEIERRLEEGTHDLVKRARDTVTTFVDKLREYKIVDDRPVGIFRDSLVLNCLETGKLIRALNVTDNPQIEQIAVQMERLANVTADQLRGESPISERLRADKIEDGQNILNKLAALDKKDEDVMDIMSQVADYIL